MMAPTATDLFCGAGGSSWGLWQAGITPIVAVNHNPVAVESHAAALAAAGTRHLCADVTQLDPAALPAADLLWASAECTTFSPGRQPAVARAARAGAGRADARFTLTSRATGFDLLRWAEAHRMPAIVAENVLEWAAWELFDVLTDGLGRLGYDHQLVRTNAHVHGAATCRDRLLLFAWHRDLPAPDTQVTGPVDCPDCGPGRGVQRWARARRPGERRYGVFGTHWQLHCDRCDRPARPDAPVAADILDAEAGEPVAGARIAEATRARLKNALAATATRPPGEAGTIRTIVLHWSKPPARRRHPGDVGGSWWPADTRPLNTVTGVDSHSVLTFPAPDGPVTDTTVDELLAAATHRMLSVPELLRASGFPADYPLAGTQRQQIIQIGMAVPPPMAAWAANAVRPVLACTPAAPAAAAS